MTRMPWQTIGREVAALVAAFQFLTVLPLPAKVSDCQIELGRSLAYYPLVGLVLGLILVGLSIVAGQLWPGSVVAALVLTGWVWLTGALHLDGFLDVCDGLFGAYEPVERLRIMRDEHMGAFALAGGGVLLLAKFAALVPALTSRSIIVVPLLGRWAMVVAVSVFPSARQAGLGVAVRRSTTWTRAISAAGFALVVSFGVMGWQGVAAVALAVVVALGLGQFMQLRLGGLTGDCYGAICELTELAALLFFLALA